MSTTSTRRSVLKTGAAVVAATALPSAMAKEVTIQDLSKGLAKPLTPANEKLAEGALKDVFKASATRLKHKLSENSEPSMIFQVRPGATTKW
ncbi:MAG: twin-arginine translocation signal domain-containing protein [Fimbriimonadaceae bacterium]